MTFKYRDERQEVAPLQSILVQIIGFPIACCDDDDALFKEFREQPLKYHSIGDVSDLKFIEADEPRIFPDEFRYRRDGVERLRLSRAGVADLQLLQFVNFLVHVGHECIEVNTFLLVDL